MFEKNWIIFEEELDGYEEIFLTRIWTVEVEMLARLHLIINAQVAEVLHVVLGRDNDGL